MSCSSEKMILPPSIITVYSMGVLTSTSRVIPVGTYTESPARGSASPPQVLCADHRSMYKKGLHAKMTGFPSVTIMKEFPLDGGFALIPVMQETVVEVWLMSEQRIPSIVIVTLLPKLEP